MHAKYYIIRCSFTIFVHIDYICVSLPTPAVVKGGQLRLSVCLFVRPLKEKTAWAINTEVGGNIVPDRQARCGSVCRYNCLDFFYFFPGHTQCTSGNLNCGKTTPNGSLQDNRRTELDWTVAGSAIRTRLFCWIRGNMSSSRMYFSWDLLQRLQISR